MNWLLISTVVSVVALAVNVLFQVGLAAGMPWGHAAYGGANRQLSERLRVTSAVAVIVWILVTILVIRRSQSEEFLFLSPGNVTIACWVIIAYLAVGVVMNGISRSKLERNIWTPVTAVALVSTVMVNLLADL